MIISASTPLLHQNCTVQLVESTMKPLNVGPTTTPARKERLRAVNALPLWCRKKRSTTVSAPRLGATPPKRPPKRRAAIKAGYWFECIMVADHTPVTKRPTMDQKKTHVRPYRRPRGTAKRGPTAIPAVAATTYIASASTTLQVRDGGLVTEYEREMGSGLL